MKRLISFIIIMTVMVTVTVEFTSAFDVSAADEDYVIDFETGYEVGNVTKIADAGKIITATAFSQIHNDTGSKVEVVQESDSNKAIKITKTKSGSGSFAGALVKLPAVISDGMYDLSFDLKIENHSVGFPTNHSFGSLTNYYSGGHSGGTYVTRGLMSPWEKNKVAWGDSTNILSQINDGKYHTFRCITDLDAGKSCYYIDDKYVCSNNNSASYKSAGYICFSVCYDTNLNGSAEGDGIYYIDNIKLKNVSNSIKSVTPANGSEEILIDSDINVTYTYPLLGTPNIDVRMNDSSLVANNDYTATWNDEKTELKILFSRGLSKSKKYEVWIDGKLVTNFKTEKIPFGADNIKTYNDSNQEISSIDDVKGKTLKVKADILNNYSTAKEYTAILVLTSANGNMCDVDMVKGRVSCESGNNTQGIEFNIDVPDTDDLASYELKLFAVDKFDKGANVLILPCEIF